MSDLVMFVSKFLEIYVQYGIKETGVAPRLVRHKDSNRPEFFGTVPKSSTMSRSPEIQFNCPELKLFFRLSKKTLNSYSFIHQTCSSPLQVLPFLNILGPGGGLY